MAKLTISPDISLKSESAAANPFLSADGLVDVAAFARLAAKITKQTKTLTHFVNVRGVQKAIRVKFAFPIVCTRKDLPKYSASLEKKGDHKYQLMRSQQIKSRAKMPAVESNVKIKVLLPAADERLDKAILAEVRKAMSAVVQHNRKALKQVDRVKTEKGKVRDAANAEFEQNTAQLKDLLIDAGVKETSIVFGQSMFGTTMLVKLPNGGVVSVGKSDTTKFNAAKRAAA